MVLAKVIHGFTFTIFHIKGNVNCSLKTGIRNISSKSIQKMSVQSQFSIYQKAVETV